MSWKFAAVTALHNARQLWTWVLGFFDVRTPTRSRLRPLDSTTGLTIGHKSNFSGYKRSNRTMTWSLHQTHLYIFFDSLPLRVAHVVPSRLCFPWYGHTFASHSSGGGSWQHHRGCRNVVEAQGVRAVLRCVSHLIAMLDVTSSSCFLPSFSTSLLIHELHTRRNALPPN